MLSDDLEGKLMERAQSLDRWLTESLRLPDFERHNLAGDASFRRYYRLKMPKQSYVVMDAPPPESPQLFINVGQALLHQGLTVPQIVAADLEQGFLLLSDFGDKLYLDALNANTADTLYEDAFRSLIKLQQVSLETPQCDEAFLKRQFQLFKDWYLDKHLKLSRNIEIENTLNGFYEKLISEIMTQPFVFVHRDFHSRNLMVLEKGNPGIIDFQDAFRGPIVYDLVSLLQDCYISWPRDQVENWVRGFQERLRHEALLSKAVTFSQFLRWFDLTGLQRHLKNLGIFSRLNYRDNKPHYLKDLIMPLRYSLETCKRYAEFEGLGKFLETVSKELQPQCAP